MRRRCCAVALSIALLMTPAALHRIVWAGEDSEALLAMADASRILALLPLAMGMAGDSYVVLSRILAQRVRLAMMPRRSCYSASLDFGSLGQLSSDCNAG